MVLGLSLFSLCLWITWSFEIIIIKSYETFMKWQFHMAQPDMSDNLNQVTKEGLSKDL